MHRNLSLKFLSLLTLLALSFFVFVPTAYAFDGRNGQTVTIGEDEVIDEDLYLSGETVIMNGTVNGDLVVFATNITINGSVSGDVQAAGKEIFINGKVGDDVFSGAAAITLGPGAEVAGDFFAGAASVETQEDSTIGGSVFIGAYQVLFSGTGAEDLNVGASRMRLEGAITGNAEISVDATDDGGPHPSMFMGPDAPSMPSVPAGLTFSDDAKIEGELEYVSVSPLPIPTSVVAGKVSHTLPPVEEEVAREIRAESHPAVAWVLDLLRRMIALIVIGLLVAYFAPGWITKATEKLQERPWPSLGIGFISLVALPFALLTFLVAAILLAVLVGALSLGNLAGLIVGVSLVALAAGIMLSILVLSYLAQMIVAYLGGRWLLNKIKPELSEKIYWPLLLGLIIIALLVAIPWLGNWIGFAVILFGLGALIQRLWQSFQKQPVAIETQA